MLRRMNETWNSIWFSAVAPQPVACFRILLGILLLIDALMLAPNLIMLLGPKGVMEPRVSYLLLRAPHVDLLRLLPDTTSWLVLFYVAYLVATVLFILGLHTRAASVAVFLGLSTLQTRNVMLLGTGDSFLRIMSFYMMFATSGAELSLDARQRSGAPPEVPAWPIRLMQIQLSVVYLASAGWQLAGETWRSGEALYYISRLYDFQRFWVPYLFEHMWTIKLLTWSTILVELIIGIGLWITPIRRYVMVLGLCFHLFIEIVLNLGLLNWALLATYVLFLTPESIERLRRKR
ncbi:MAG: hypothetical protein FJX76_13260 [Armatimonadetes bacterium]|nr:hypothetical protein [Armatimonadota bacterium]